MKFNLRINLIPLALFAGAYVLSHPATQARHGLLVERLREGTAADDGMSLGVP